LKIDDYLRRFTELHPKSIDLSLDRIRRLLSKLGDPQKRLPPIIHVAGTNGKGSVVANLRAILGQAGRKAHCYTSPHLIRFHERIRLQSGLIDDDSLEALFDECVAANGDDLITFFEITTVAALLAFSRQSADYVLLEVGLGGRFDATNVVDQPLSTVITPVSLDHEYFLGNNLPGIAYEKASIAKTNTPLLSAKQQPAVNKVIHEVVTSKGGKLITKWDYQIKSNGFTYSDSQGSLNLPIPNLHGTHQVSNAALAIAVLRHQDKILINEKHLAKGITNAKWPARMQNITNSRFGKLLNNGSELWLDGGHNPAAGQVVADSFKDRKLILICGMMENKDASGYIQAFKKRISKFYGLQIDGEASHSAANIIKIARSLKVNSAATNSVEEALVKIGNKHEVTVIICGSLYLAGQVLADNALIPD
jgi:dihydrofolate synthase/folylpolyglutamate synthase